MTDEDDEKPRWTKSLADAKALLEIVKGTKMEEAVLRELNGWTSGFFKRNSSS